MTPPASEPEPSESKRRVEEIIFSWVCRLASIAFLLVSAGNVTPELRQLIPIANRDFFVLLHWVVCGTAVLTCLNAYQVKRFSWAYLMGGIALLFNPFIPVVLQKNTWIILYYFVSFTIFVSLLLLPLFNIKFNSQPSHKNKLDKNSTRLDFHTSINSAKTGITGFFTNDHFAWFALLFFFGSLFFVDYVKTVHLIFYGQTAKADYISSKEDFEDVDDTRGNSKRRYFTTAEYRYWVSTKGEFKTTIESGDPDKTIGIIFDPDNPASHLADVDITPDRRLYLLFSMKHLLSPLLIGLCFYGCFAVMRPSKNKESLPQKS